MIHMFGNTYELLINHKEGWNQEAFRERYSEVLDKYDYIFGDWGYNQLRLKGFFEKPKGNLPHEMKIESLGEYLMEYCNFGCAHFLIKKVPQKVEPKKTKDKNFSEKRRTEKVEEKV